MRQICKQILTLTKTYGFLLILLAVLPLNPAIGQDKKVVTNALTGVAISGYDPVAYFTEGAPTLGSPLYELVWRGVPWYFATPANRDVFEADPEIYEPMFGGHGAMALARGYLSDGNPQIFTIHRNRLLLFYSVGNREAFNLSPDPAFRDAIASWQATSDPAGIFPDQAQQPPER